MDFTEYASRSYRKCRAPAHIISALFTGSIDFLDAWYWDTETGGPVVTEGMCPNRPGTGPDRAFVVNDAYVVNTPNFVEGKSSCVQLHVTVVHIKLYILNKLDNKTRWVI